MRYLLAAVVLVAAGLIVFLGGQRSKENRQVSKEQTQLKPQTNSEGQVEVEVTPVDVSPNSEAWKFGVTLNTHSVELDYDLKKITVLVDDKGTAFRPEIWEGAGPGGHHREGILKFPTFPTMTDTITLNIQDVGDIAERSFTWSIE